MTLNGQTCSHIFQWRIQDRGDIDPLGGHGPLTQALFSENVCKNERIGSRRSAKVFIVNTRLE